MSSVPREPTEGSHEPCDREPLTLVELLTGWLANARDVHAPDTLEGCDDYSRQLEQSQRIGRDAAALCERLRVRVSALVDEQAHDLSRVLNRLTPPG